MGIKLVNSEVDGAEIKLLKIRNPWSKEYFKGEWSDSSSKWTADLLDEVDHEKDNDGVYYMSLEYFARNLESMTIAEDV